MDSTHYPKVPLNKKPSLNPRTRELIHRVMDGCHEASMTTLLWQIYQYRKCDEIMMFLIAHGLTGLRLLHAYKFDFDSSTLKLATTALRAVENAKDKAVLYGRDWVAR